MKILRVTNEIYPDVMGGVPLHVHHLSKDLSNHGHHNTILTCSSTKKNFEIYDCFGYRVINHKILIAPLGNSLAPLQFKSLIRMRHQYDIIHAHGHIFFSTIMSSCIKNIGSSPLIVTTHGIHSTSASDWFNNLYMNTIARWILKSADRIICYTLKEKEIYCKMLHLNPEKISVIHNGVDTELFIPIEKEIQEPMQQLLWIGRFVPGKGVNILIEAYNKIYKKYPNTRLILVGEGPLRNKINAQIEKLGIKKNIEIYDYWDNSKLVNLYNESDIFILPSFMEGVPRTMLEAMACGIPVIVSELPHLKDIVKGAGLLTPRGDSHRLSKSIEHLINDNELRSHLGRQGREKVVENFSWKDTVEQTIKVYKEFV